MAGNATDQGRSVTAKLAAILSSFTSGSTYQLNELARRNGLPMSTTHRLAVELTATDFLQRDPNGGFQAGPAIRDLSDPTPRRPTLAERGPHVLEDLAEALHLRARLGVLDGFEVACIEKMPGHTPVTCFSPAARRPAHATALGKALLAFASPDIIRLVCAATLPAYTARTLTRPDRLHDALRRVRHDGVALDHGELSPDVFAVAVPVLDPGAVAIAAVEVEVENLSPDTVDAVTPALVLAAHGLVRELHPGWWRAARPPGRGTAPDGQESAG
jgi:IclR family acetate operon transcriptional repressor